jgi:hypothetical protein
MKKIGLAILLLSGFALTGATCDKKTSSDGGLPNPAMQVPDQVAWQLFAQVTAGNDAPLFESWASDADTFNPTGAVWPTGDEAKDGLDVHPAVVPTRARGGLAATAQGAPAGHGQSLAAAAKAGPAPAAAAAPASGSAAAAAPASGSTPPAPANPCTASTPPLTGINAEPGAIPGGVAEEVRRNQPAFDYIVSNNLNGLKGLQAAFKANLDVSFPVDSIEVKTNWIPVSCIPTYYPNVNANNVADFFYVTNDSNGTPHALLSMHVISKQVPNWTWATFEHQLNPGRCDWIGCRDSYGAANQFVAPADNNGQNQGTVYPACTKTPAVGELLAGSKPVFANYCLKGSQTDFTDNTGLAIRMGNSVIEYGFVNQASCMTCHGGAGWDVNGSMVDPINTDIGAIPYQYFWTILIGPPAPPLPPNIPPYQGEPGMTRKGISADFVWSIPFCAFDDTKTPAVANPDCPTGR